MAITRTVSIIVGAIVLLAGGAGAADFELALDLRPGGGAEGTRMVSNGVPLIAGQATDTKELHVIGPDGKEVPAQFRVLARWWRVDKSIRWVLVSFIRSERESAKPIYKLVGRKAGAARPKTALKVTQDDDSIRIDTGVAQFEISKKAFNLLNRVVIDGKTIVHPDPKLGSVVTDPKGRKYYSSKGATKVRILEQGPVMVKVMAQGWHVSDAEGAFKPGLYGYEITMTFWAGKALCDIDAILTNNSAKPIGEPHFEDWSLLTRIGKAKGDWKFKGLGQAKMTVDGKAGESALLHQDSVGTQHWKKNLGIAPAGHPTPPMPDLATFRGYKLFKTTGENKVELGQGDFADGVVACDVSGLGCTVSPRYFWQQFPSAVQFGGDGVVRLSPFPAEYKQIHWLEDASAKAQEFQLCFYAKGDQATAATAAKRYQKRVFALPSPEHCGAAGALSDIGPYMMHEKIAKPAKEHFSLARMEQQALSPDAKYGNGYGWQVFGMNWIERAGVSGTNYEPIGTSNSLWMHLLNAHPGRLEYGMRLARHARDVRTYHIEGQDNLALWTTWRPGYWKNCVVEHVSRLAGGAIERTKNKHPDWKNHPYSRHRFPLPNFQHLNLDETYDLYLLTGDDRALRCMRTIADHGVVLSTLHPRPRRARRMTGWCLRTLGRYYELTGDKRYKPYLQKAVDQIWHDVNKAGPTDPKGGTWQLAIYARGAVNAYRAGGDERMRDLAIGCADWAMTYEINPEHGYAYQQFPDPWNHKPEDRGKVLPEEYKKYWFPEWSNGYMIDLFANAYHQTGRKKYLRAMEFAWKHNTDLPTTVNKAHEMPNPQKHHADAWWLGYFPTAMYMAYGPRADKTAPAAVADLKAAVKGDQVTLTWIAPGDDGKKGKASVYQIKYATKPILEIVPFPEKMKTHITFWGSENVSDEPAPKRAGSGQSYTFTGLKPGKYFFALKTRDECNNQSEMSNVVSVEIGR